MIPLVLKIKNFLSYSSDLQTIDFRAYPVICLSGKNGHGKSALLDAITWALWGQARKAVATTKPDQGVVRIGQSRVHVSLDFDLKGQIYRVSRDFFNSGLKSGANLEFQVYDDQTLTYKSLTDKTIKDTQTKITQVVGLDFETFINTSFFKQGASNEFSKKSPKERKQIICDILGLEKYDQVSAKALNMSKELLSESEKLKTLNSRLEKEVSLYEQIIQELEIAKKVLKDNQNSILVTQQNLVTLGKDLQILEAQSAKFQELSQTIELWQAKRKELRSLDLLVTHKVNFQALQDQRKKLLAQQSEINNLQIACQQKVAKLVGLKDNLALLKDSFGKKWETEKEDSRSKLENIKTEFNKITATIEQNTLLAKACQTNIDQATDQLEQCQKDHLAEFSTHKEQNVLCPTCKQLVADFAKEKFLLDRQASFTSTTKNLLDFINKNQSELVALEKTIADNSKLAQELKNNYQSLLGEYKKNFNPELFLGKFQEQAKVQAVTKEIQELEEEQINLAKISKANQEMSMSIAKVDQELESVINLHKIDAQRHSTRISLIKTWKEISVQSAHWNNSGKNLTDKITGLKNTISNSEKNLQNQHKEIDSLHQSIGRLEHEKTKLEALAKEIKNNNAQLALIEQEALWYQILSNAYGKNGIQGLIVESVIPEIENEANKILATLSGDCSRIYIEPLKDLKKGGFRESLDIKIFDNAGVRSYEMFSGGEAFRIDFALRIGISKLLAKRAGAQLQTLIIDEGFGSQDVEGLGRLIEGIHMIKNDFKKIIIVSHLQDFKDEFPVHFVVEKSPTGSVISVQTRV